MWLVYLGTLLFVLPHLGSLVTRQLALDFKQSWGEKAYKGIYSLSSLLGIVLMGSGYVLARDTAGDYYEPWHGGRHALLLMIFLAFILIFSNQSKGYIARITHHPFSLGMVLWSTAHLMANGEKPVVWIFGSILLVGLTDIVFNISRGKLATHSPNWRHDARGLIVGIGLYLIFAFAFHPYIIGIPVVQ
jgi:uncharacterized membrane protein